jgi:hypothetical protein
MESQNGWQVLPTASDTTRWVIPGTGRELNLAPGPAGFILVHLADWFHDRVERLDLGVWDEWGWAYRAIRGAETWSNHASGTAEDLNATRHPLGVAVADTFTATQVRRIRRRLRLYRGLIRWGGEYKFRPDGMHFEVTGAAAPVRALARMLRLTPRGRAVVRANPAACRGW